MKKVKRNDPCPCGSGKKFKKCHYQVDQTKLSSEKINQLPIRVSAPALEGHVKYIPYDISADKKTVTRRKHYNSLVDKIINPKVTEMLAWENDEITEFSEKLVNFCSFQSEPFDLVIYDINQFTELLNKQPKVANSIYWNEIDQNYYQYRVNTLNLFSSRVRHIVDNIDDNLTSTSVSRQLIELTIYAIANQWVITTAYNILGKKLKNNKKCYFTWKELEEFVVSIAIWPTKNLKYLYELLKKKEPKELTETIISKDYTPTTYQQFKIAKWIAGNFDENPDYKGKDFLPCIEEIEYLYRYLCKFVHPTPLMFPVPRGFDFITDDEVKLSIIICIIKIMRNCFNSFDTFFKDDVFVKIRFQDLAETYINDVPDDGYKYAGIHDSFIKDVMNKYKSIILPTTEGDLEIMKLENFSKKAKRIAEFYDKSNEDIKRKIDEYFIGLKQ